MEKWFQKDLLCAGVDLKDDFLHVPIRSSIKIFLRIAGKVKLYEKLVILFGLKCSPIELTFIVKLFFNFFGAEE